MWLCLDVPTPASQINANLVTALGIHFLVSKKQTYMSDFIQ